MIVEILIDEVLVKSIESIQGPVPRVGELIELSADNDALPGHQFFIVYEVSYKLNNNQLDPFVMCAPYENTTTREALLKEFGWQA